MGKNGNLVCDEPFMTYVNTPFRGKVKSMHLVSDACGYPPDSQKGKEVVQFVTLYRDGRLQFLGTDSSFNQTRQKTGYVLANDAKRWLEIAAAYFSRKHETKLIQNDFGGYWELRLVNTKGEMFRFDGEWVNHHVFKKKKLSLLSAWLREISGIRDLYGFDGNNRLRDVRKITAELRRRGGIRVTTEESGRVLYASAKAWINQEKLILDLDRKTVEISRNSYSWGKMTQRYEFRKDRKGFAKRFYSKFDGPDLFLYTGDDLAGDDARRTPRERELNYKITLDYRKGPSRVIKGRFDRQGLPTEFGIFAEFVKTELYSFPEAQELMNPDFYERRRYGDDEYIFCSVIFKEKGKHYYYLTDDETIDTGDVVLVPVGPENKIVPAYVVDIEYFTGEDAPYPVERIKKIVHKCTEEDMEMEIGRDIDLAPDDIE